MDYFYNFDVNRMWSQFTKSVPDITSFCNVLKKHVHEGLHDDWQIRLSFILFLCTLVNIVLIGIAWRIFGDSVTNIFYNKPKSPARRLDNLYRHDVNLTQSMEDLIAKKTQ